MTQAEFVPARRLEEIAASIRARQTNIAENIIGIGYDLIEAKAMLKHGEFGRWLADNFSMTQQTAGNYMRVAERFGGKLKTGFQFQYTILVELAKLPPAEIENFTAENPNAATLSVRKLRGVIQQWKQAKQPATDTKIIAVETPAAIEAPETSTVIVDTSATTTKTTTKNDLIQQLQAKITALETRIAVANETIAELQEVNVTQAEMIDSLIVNAVETQEFSAEYFDTILTRAELQADEVVPAAQNVENADTSTPIVAQEQVETADATLEEVYTLKQAAEVLNVSTNAIKDYLKPSRHCLERVSIDGKDYVSKRSVDAYKLKRDSAKKKSPATCAEPTLFSV